VKILAVCSTLDLGYDLGCTPSWWQFFKALYETGNEVIAVPFLGTPVETLWWRTYPNPFLHESRLYNSVLDHMRRFHLLGHKPANSPSVFNRPISRYVNRRWKEHLAMILDREHDVDLLVFMNVPITHIAGIASGVKKTYGIPVAFIEGDMPTILPGYQGDNDFKFSYYTNADLSEFDAFFTNSTGIVEDLKALHAKNIHPFLYAADPSFCSHVPVKKDIDVSYFSLTCRFRDEWVNAMVTRPSQVLPDCSFVIGGRDGNPGTGNARVMPVHSFSGYRDLCCQSKICLNITRSTHTVVNGTSTARPFELAAFGACMVSQPYPGIGEWFEPGREMIVLKDQNEAADIYQWLLTSDEERERIGARARERVLREHTYRHRAELFTRVMRNVVR
jgi:hypothetical protein